MNIPAAMHVEIALDDLAQQTPARRAALLKECAHELHSVGTPQFEAAGLAAGGVPFASYLFDAGYFLGLRVAAAIVAGGGAL